MDDIINMDRPDMLKMRKKAKDIDEAYNKTIIIEVPAFKDPELLNTMYSALIQADFPDRVHFAVCFQDDDVATLMRIRGFKHAKIAYVRPEDARGTCYARYMCQQLYDGEDFAMHIDSHMRFIKHWDTELIRQWMACEDDKAVISFYAQGLKHEWCTLKLDAPEFSRPGFGGRIAVKSIDEGMWRVQFLQKLYLKDRENAIIKDRTPFISGHYLFGPGRMTSEVLMDPYMWYQGDEFAYGIRLFTYGYNVYTSEFCYALHKYGRKERQVPSSINDRRKREQARLSVLMGLSNDIDIAPYGVGPVRTLAEYQEFAGIEFATKAVAEKAMMGIYGFDPIIRKT